MRPKGNGRIISFYSYKGGVGRTMALANVAFLAAAQGSRVIVMDWDLEAPGLHYYFRGFQDAAEARALKESKGILNLLWDWTRRLEEATDASTVRAVLKSFDQGVFGALAREIPLGPGNQDGCLHFLNAGSTSIEGDGDRPYEEALARFSWPAFFNDGVGGSLLTSLVDWAKASYDYVLIDSRTGLADVAGICTVQMPDVVALCFVLNRQNIDGIAKVAAAIRSRRGAAIEIHAVPMRISASGTGEEDDARARAIHEMSRVGSLSQEAVQDDFRLLAIRSEPNVPYYETLAPVLATEISTDPLTLNYLRLANGLLGSQLSLPKLDEAWLAGVKRRLQPRNATVEYLAKLNLADEGRAAEEIGHLLDTAYDTIVDGGSLQDDYAKALVEAALTTGDIDLVTPSTALIRELAAVDPQSWQPFLVETLERYLAEWGLIIDQQDHLAILQELDSLLISSDDRDTQLRRVHYLRRAARINVDSEDFDAATSVIAEIVLVLRLMSRSSMGQSPEQADKVTSANVDVSLLGGEIYAAQENYEKARGKFRSGLKKLKPLCTPALRSDAPSLGFHLNSRMATLPVVPVETAAAHALEAARFAQGTTLLASQFVPLAEVVLALQNNDMATEFCHRALSFQDRREQVLFASYQARSSKATLLFMTTAASLGARLAGVEPEARVQSLRLLCQVVLSVWRTTTRRRLQIFREPDRSSMISALADLGKSAGVSGIEPDIIDALAHAASSVEHLGRPRQVATEPV